MARDTTTNGPALPFDPERILPDRDFGHRIGASVIDIRDSFIKHVGHDESINERIRIVTEHPERHVSLTDRGIEVLRESYALARDRGVLSMNGETTTDSAAEMMGRFLGSCEQDLVFMRPGSDGILRMEGACVAYPSNWDPPSKIGTSLHDIHAIVPGLQEEIGDSIDRFLARMDTQKAYQRSNWGMSASKSRNNHPALGLPRLEHDTPLSQISFRVEQQSLIRLQETGGVLFVIDLIRTDLLDVLENPAAARGLQRALSTMSDAMATYKGLAAILPTLLQRLSHSD